MFRFWKYLSVSRKLQLLAAIAIFAVITSAGSSVYLSIRAKRTAHYLLKKGLSQNRLISQFAMLLQKHSGLVSSLPAMLDRTRLDEARLTKHALETQLIATMTSAGPESENLATTEWWTDGIRHNLPLMFASSERVLDFAHNFVQDKALTIAEQQYSPVADNVQEIVQKRRIQQSQLIDEQIKDLLFESDLMVTWTFGAACSVLVILLASLAVTRGMLKRLFCIQRAMASLADRHHEISVPSLTDSDEIGAMAQAVQVFKENLQQLVSQEAELRKASVRFETALSNMSQGLCMFDGDGLLDVFNHRYCEIVGIDSQEMRTGLSYREVLALSLKAGHHRGLTLDELLAERQAFVARFQGIDLRELGDGKVVAISHCNMVGGGWVSTYEDVTERHKAEERLTFMARHDALTSLANRLLYHERLADTLPKLSAGDGVAVLSLDLDKFKIVNDTLGHPVGDALLQAVAKRLLHETRESDTVVRLGGDEFAVIQLSPDQPTAAKTLAERIIAALNAPFEIGGSAIIIGVSVGIAIAFDNSATSDELLKRSDIALYRTKTDGRGSYKFFEPEMDARMQARRMLEIDLRRAIVEQQLSVFYQPLVTTKTGEISGFEALVRWNHPTRGLISPADFIPIAEETGLIGPIGAMVLRKACEDATKWPENIKIAVNLSPLQFRGGLIVCEVKEALASSGLSAGRLELEITESLLLQDSELILGALHEIRALGVCISMDDFGTGYSSLSYLRRFPFNKIKIDQSFIRNLEDDPDAIAIVRAILALGHSLGMSVIAENVETAGQLKLLHSEGCQQVQGYLLSRPRPFGSLCLDRYEVDTPECRQLATERLNAERLPRRQLPLSA